MSFHQVEVDPRDRAKTAFLTNCSFYVYNIIPFSFCNAPAAVQRFMERVLRTLIGLGVLVYLDDVLINAETPEQLIEILITVLKLLAKAGLKFTASMCSLFTQSVNYFGRVVSINGINPDFAKVDKIKQWPKPKKETTLAFFLGRCNYYQNLITSFAHISDSLYKVLNTEMIEYTEFLKVNFEEL